jgi:hypothetical protein
VTVVQRHRHEELAPPGVRQPRETRTGPSGHQDQRCRGQLGQYLRPDRRGLGLREALTGVQADHPPLLGVLDRGHRRFQPLPQALDDTFLGRRQIPGVHDQHGPTLIAAELGKPVQQSALADPARSIHPQQYRLLRTVQQLGKDGDLGVSANEAAADALAEAFA